MYRLLRHGLRDPTATDPLFGAKNKMGVGFMAMSFDQALRDLADGNPSGAASNATTGALISATTVPPLRDALVSGISKVPVLRETSEKIGHAFDFLKVTVSGTRIPLAGVAVSTVFGGAAAAVRAIDGDTTGAVGEVAVTGMQAATTAAGVIAGALLCSRAVSACATVAVTGTFLISEAFTEATSVAYNNAHGTNIRNSSIGTLVRYAAPRMDAAFNAAASLIESGVSHIDKQMQDACLAPTEAPFNLLQGALCGKGAVR
ncbi:MAG: hypothetical protein V4735_04970 [Pseudomonadota bacterium]